MPQNFDYVIIGGGLAGLQLALSFSKDSYFKDKTIAVVDPSTKTNNDKTWSFWEKGAGEWDAITYRQWTKGYFKSPTNDLELHLNPYRYKMLRSIDFYNYVKSKLSGRENISFIQDEIESLDKASGIAVGKKNNYSGLHIFDSRITGNYLDNEKSSTLFQHFKGYIIHTPVKQFDPTYFTMMDFRLQYKDSTSFTYVLPLSPQKALIEFTFFTPYLTEESIYDTFLNNYISSILKIDDYTIEETEKGVIPMTDFPFYKENSPRITKIGTAGSWVKGSTGYSFKNSEKKAKKIVANIKSGNNPGYDLINKTNLWYDAIFLDVLSRRNDLGKEIFNKLYSKNSPQDIFAFLDEEATPREEIKIMLSLYHWEFIRSFFKKSI